MWWVFLVVCLSVTYAKEEHNPGCGALCDYVHTDDGMFDYFYVTEYYEPGVTTYVLNMTSQKWFDESWSDRPIWWHYLVVHVPDQMHGEYREHGLVYASTGNNNDDVPTQTTRHVEETKEVALDTGMVTAVLRQVPAQPIVFADEIRSRSEDSIIAYTWRVFLEDESAPPEILLRFPMVKSVSKAMDAVTDFVQTLNGDQVISKYMIAGESKRGWTTWLMGAADTRVVAMAPVILSCLNMIENLHHYYTSLGGWPLAFGDYWLENITSWLDEPRTKVLESYIDPFAYKDYLTMPKLAISATNDEFFFMDDYWYYWDQMLGTKYLWYLENSGHSIHHGPVYMPTYWENIAAFYISVIEDFPFPDFHWDRYYNETSGSIVMEITSDDEPTEVVAWWAETPEVSHPRRDFRESVNIPPVDSGVMFYEEPVTRLSENVYEFAMNEPSNEEAFTAFYIRVRFDGANNRDLYFTTEVNIIPDEMPFEDCYGTDCRGVLT